MKAGSVIIGILIGGIAGAAVGVLLAPDKGSKTRKKLKNTSDGYVDSLKTVLDEFLDKMGSSYSKSKDEVTGFVNNRIAKLEETMKNN